MRLGDRPLTRHAPKSSCPALCRASMSFLGAAAKTWMAGPSPAMTAKGSRLEGWGGASSCFETHRSAVRLRKQSRSRHAAMLLSMRARRGRCRRWTKGPTCGCKKMARRRGPCFRPVIYRELCNCSAWRGYANRNPGRTISAVPALPRCAGSAGMSEREATCECRNGSRFLTFTGIYRQLCDGNVWRVTRGQKRVEDARRRAYDPAGPSFFAKFCEKRWIAPQLGLARVAHRNAPQVL
jgi:hypothetical protein